MPGRRASPARSENEFDISESLFRHDNDEANAASATTSPRDEQAILHEPDEDEAIIADQLASNRKASNLKGRTVKKGGGFQAMGLNANLLKAITRKGFSVPTPIQRKTIPLLLQDKDVVGMARTGSGKTAAFVVPMIERLKTHSAKVGARALVLSPSRELALQTLQVVKELGRGTDLKSVLLVGGDSLEEQFGSMASNPDIIIATPGRFLHLKVEMGLDLMSIRYVVFDEADRLFEMGFASQLTEVLHALPPSRQTMLFSATLPKSLVEFAKAGLQEPVLVRLDAESKISPDLQNAFFTVRSAEKEAALLHILQNIITMPPKPNASAAESEEAPSQTSPSKKRKRDESNPASGYQAPNPYSTIIFAATKHHVAYLAHLLDLAGYAVSYVYGSLDQTARKMQVQSFRSGRTNILVVTDVAARGIDIPVLANVINFDFPSQPKIFVHRVGRTARAGQKGWSYSIVRDTDAPYLLDLQLFLGKKLIVGRSEYTQADYATDLVLGSLKRDDVARSAEFTDRVLEEGTDLFALQGVAAKGEKQYQRSRNAASVESANRARALVKSNEWASLHPLFIDEAGDIEAEREHMLAKISAWRPRETIFEIGAKTKRQKGDTELINSIRRVRNSLDAKRAKSLAKSQMDGQNVEHQPSAEGYTLTGNAESDKNGNDAESADADSDSLSLASSSDLEATFSRPEPKASMSKAEHNPSTSFRSSDFITYTPREQNLAESAAYSVHSGSAANFSSVARSVTMDLNDDEGSKGFGESRGMLRWDKRHKKYVRKGEAGEDGIKLVRGESGAKIPASFRSGRFDKWKKANRVGKLPRVGEAERAVVPGGATSTGGAGRRFRHTKTDKAKPLDKFRGDYEKRRKRERERADGPDGPGPGKKGKAVNEVRGLEAIRKQRREKEKRREKNARPSKKAGKGFRGKGK
ncbi:MAG: hypothetical protein Q9227_005232 [Pyrenula ochraceoflavens]